jgi:adenylate kinase
VPDEVTNDLVRDRLGQPDARIGFLLDGYPRTQAQVDELDDMLGAQQHELDHVVELAVDSDIVVQRLIERAEKEGRADDTPETIRKRQEIYVAETAPLIDFYDQRGLLVRVDGLGSVDEVTDRIVAALDAAHAAAGGAALEA